MEHVEFTGAGESLQPQAPAPGYTPGILERQCLEPGIPAVPEPGETALVLIGCLAALLFTSAFKRRKPYRL